MHLGKRLPRLQKFLLMKQIPSLWTSSIRNLLNFRQEDVILNRLKNRAQAYHPFLPAQPRFSDFASCPHCQEENLTTRHRHSSCLLLRPLRSSINILSYPRFKKQIRNHHTSLTIPTYPVLCLHSIFSSPSNNLKTVIPLTYIAL